MTSSKKIKVLLAGPYPHAGGMEGTYGRILNNISNSSTFADKIDFIPLRMTLPADGNYAKRQAMDILRFMRSLKSKPDVIHFIMQKYRALYREFPILKISKAMGIKTIVDIRAGTIQWMLKRENARLQNAMMRNLFRTCDEIVLECKKDMEFISETFNRQAVWIPNAMLQSDYESVTPANLNIQQNQPIKMIFSGRYSTKKGVDVMLKSLDVLSEKGIKAELHLTGGGNEPELINQIKAYTKSPPNGTSVIDHGWDVPDLYALLASCHIFVMPTCWPGEGHPNSVTEAMMSGLSMILSDWLHREDIVPEDGHIIIPPKDPKVLADAVASYVKNPETLISAGNVNRQYVKDTYLDTVCYPKFLSMYEMLAQK